ncbi:MAG: Type IV pilus assembly protein PilM [Thermoanaerobacterales bacterium 50_218]|nr:MAG: Type IV pilus assembly protein PilM [Thermoanaerobacterales bacterium 50_218]HAA89357.1 pilus assembly protein PilM [Peptococcaceae bacterium]
MKRLLQKILPKKRHFLGIDIGASYIKAAEVKIIDGEPTVVALRKHPSPQGVWTEQLDEQALVEALKEVVNPPLKEVITCIGGEKLVSRVVRFPRMSEKELEAAVKFEVEKFVPTPTDQLLIRYVCLGPVGNNNRENTQNMENVLLLAVPAATVYQYYGIFSRAGMLVTAVDFQAFALWRLFGRKPEAGTFALLDIGARTSHFVVVRDGLIRFLRLLPVGGDSLTEYLMETYGLEFDKAQQMKEEADLSPSVEAESPGVLQTADVFRDGLLELTKELQRSLEYFSAQEKLSVEKLVLSGGTSNMKGLDSYLQEVLGLPVEIGIPDVAFSDGVEFDPCFSVAIGLALREVVS